MEKKLLGLKVLVFFSVIFLIFLIFLLDIEIPTIFPKNHQITDLTLIFYVIIFTSVAVAVILIIIKIYIKHKEVKEIEEEGS